MPSTFPNKTLKEVALIEKYTLQNEEEAQKALALDGNELKGKPVKLRMWASLKDRPGLGVVVLNLPFGEASESVCLLLFVFTQPMLFSDNEFSFRNYKERCIGIHGWLWRYIKPEDRFS